MKLLVSVRSVEEAEEALRGGADLVDVKEPSRGSLGNADKGVIEQIVAKMAGRAVLSAAMGELRDAIENGPLSDSLDYLKWGLADCLEFPWRERLLQRRAAMQATIVPTAYADYQRAEAPSLAEVVEFVQNNGFRVLLIDTWGKDGSNLFSWIEERPLLTLVDQLKRTGIQVALAGSLTHRDVPMLQRIEPAWVAVRGAVCDGGDRKSRIDEAAVRSFKQLLF